MQNKPSVRTAHYLPLCNQRPLFADRRTDTFAQLAMTSSQLAAALTTNIVDMNSTLYGRMFDDELLADSPRPDLDPQFRRMLDIYSALTDEQQLHLLAHFRQIAVDSVSSFLGIIDGSSGLSGHDGDFALSYADAPVGSGDLQNAFLQHIEDSE